MKSINYINVIFLRQLFETILIGLHFLNSVGGNQN